MFKQAIKKNEARILIYLQQADLIFRYARKISAKLDVDYNYVCILLMNMKQKGWLKATKSHNKIFYEVTKKAPSIKTLVLVLHENRLKSLNQEKLLFPK